MITIMHARQAHGYSGCDHLLDDGPLAAIIGRQFHNLAAAAKAAGKALRGTQDRRCAGAPVWLTDDAGNSWRVWADGTVA